MDEVEGISCSVSGPSLYGGVLVIGLCLGKEQEGAVCPTCPGAGMALQHISFLPDRKPR